MATHLIKLELKVYYDLNGVSPDELKHKLAQVIELAIGEGLLTGHTQAEVEDWNYNFIEE